MDFEANDKNNFGINNPNFVPEVDEVCGVAGAEREVYEISNTDHINARLLKSFRDAINNKAIAVPVLAEEEEEQWDENK